MSLLQMSSVIVKKEQGCLRAQLPFASFFIFWLKIPPKFQESQSHKPEGQDFPNLMSNLSLIDNAL